MNRYRVQENGEGSSEPQSRTRTPSPERKSRPMKRRKIRHRSSRGLTFPDGSVFLSPCTTDSQHSNGQLSQQTLSRNKKPVNCSECGFIFSFFSSCYVPMPSYRFYAGCSTFLPVFDCQIDTFDGLHERSPFAVDAICTVAARVRDGGGDLLILFCYRLISLSIRECKRDLHPMFGSSAKYFVRHIVCSGKPRRSCASDE